nr:MAG TPA: hypothetical protein [Caudoviricetes sp.]
MELLFGQEYESKTHQGEIKPLVSLADGVSFETSETKHPFKNSLIYEYKRIRRLSEISF